ncbi:MAG: D-2-hydroxyacid dehydrogenase family protein, partial [Luteibacter sp.]
MPIGARPRIAVLDDYQSAASVSADWSTIERHADVEFFHDSVSEPDALAARLAPFDIVSVMRERAPLPASVLEALPGLKLIVSTGPRNASIDTVAAERLGIAIAHTGYFSSPTIELTWALILASARNIVAEHNSLRSGGWQVELGDDLAGQTLGIIGLGNVGGEVARIGLAFGMKVIAWSENLTAEDAAKRGVTRVDRDQLFREADIVSVHVQLSERSRGLVGPAEFALMKPSAKLVNTSRSAIVDEVALREAVASRRIAGAAVDVYDREPLDANHPYRSAGADLITTPHIGYVSKALYRRFYGDTVKAIEDWL